MCILCQTVNSTLTLIIRIAQATQQVNLGILSRIWTETDYRHMQLRVKKGEHVENL
jgi:hypothetical protein